MDINDLEGLLTISGSTAKAAWGQRLTITDADGGGGGGESYAKIMHRVDAPKDCSWLTPNFNYGSRPKFY